MLRFSEQLKAILDHSAIGVSPHYSARQGVVRSNFIPLCNQRRPSLVRETGSSQWQFYTTQLSGQALSGEGQGAVNGNIRPLGHQDRLSVVQAASSQWQCL